MFIINTTPSLSGMSFNLDDWFADDPSRSTTAAWYDTTDITTLFQNTAGTVPVTSISDPVQLILNKGGNTDYDLIIHDTLLPGVYKEVGGIGNVDLNSVAGFRCRNDVEIKVPLFIASAFAWRSMADATLGVVRSSVAYLQVMSALTGQNRPSIYTNGTFLGGGEPGFNPWEGTFGDCPSDSPLVCHSQFSIGTHDVGVNALGEVSEANGWDGDESDVTARISLGMSTNTSEADADIDFYGGFVYFGTIDSGLRADVVEYIRSGTA